MEDLNFDNQIDVKNDLYCLNDIAEKLIGSTNIKEYIKKIQNKEWLDGNYYITKDHMIEILLRSKAEAAKKYLEYLKKKDNINIDNSTTLKKEKDDIKHITTNEDLQSKTDNRNFIDNGSNEIIFNSKRILFFEYKDILYFKGKDVCDLLEYTNSRREIELHVDKEDIFSFINFKGNEGSNKLLLPYDNTLDYINIKSKCIFKESESQNNKDIEEIKKIKLMLEKKIKKQIDPQTTFINESGLYSLILSSKMPEAKKFKHWVTNDVLVSIRKYGSYNTIQNAPIYDEKSLKSFENTPTVYIIRVSNSLYKFGQSMHLTDRMSAHKSILKYEEIIKIYGFPYFDYAINVENKIKKYVNN